MVSAVRLSFGVVVGVSNVEKKRSFLPEHALQLLECRHEGLNISLDCRFMPNLVSVTMISEALGRSVRLRISANALKSVDHRGGLDAFLMKAGDEGLSAKALELKRQIRKKRALAA